MDIIFFWDWILHYVIGEIYEHIPLKYMEKSHKNIIKHRIR